MTTASWRFRSVCDEDFDKVLNDLWILTKTSRLFALDFCALINYHAIEIQIE